MRRPIAWVRREQLQRRIAAALMVACIAGMLAFAFVAVYLATRPAPIVSQPLVISSAAWGSSSQGLRVPAAAVLTCQPVRTEQGQGLRALVCE